MTRAEVIRLLRRFVFLLVLCGGVVFFVSEDVGPPALASGCCEECDGGFQSCLQQCYELFPAGAERDSCLAECRSVSFNCLRHCDWCNEPPTGEVVRSYNPVPHGYTVCFALYFCDWWDGQYVCTVYDILCYV